MGENVIFIRIFFFLKNKRLKNLYPFGYLDTKYSQDATQSRFESEPAKLHRISRGFKYGNNDKLSFAGEVYVSFA